MVHLIFHLKNKFVSNCISYNMYYYIIILKDFELFSGKWEYSNI